MGLDWSMESKRERRDRELRKQHELYEKALKNYHHRLSRYHEVMYQNPNIRMSYYDYMEWCRQQYELELIPESLRYGQNYTEYDEYGVLIRAGSTRL